MGNSFKSALKVKSIKSKSYYKAKMALRVPKLVGSKWVYEYPVSAAPVTESNDGSEPNTEDTSHSAVYGDWRGAWPTDALGPKPRIVGGKLIVPKLIASHSAGNFIPNKINELGYDVRRYF